MITQLTTATITELHAGNMHGLTMAKTRWDASMVVPSGFPALDRICRDEGGGCGLAKGWHVVFAAKSGAGKSVMGLNLAANAVKAGHDVGYLSLEMSKAQLVTRFAAIVSGKPIQELEPGPRFDLMVATEADVAVADQPGKLFVADELSTVGDLVSVMRQLAPDEDGGGRGVTLFITDYIQLAWTDSADTMLARTTEASHQLRRTAKRLKVVSVALSQLKMRGIERGTKPSMHDLYGGAPLENDADLVILFDHTSYVRTERTASATMIVDKNRHGPTVTVPLHIDYESLRWTEQFSPSPLDDAPEE